MLVGVVGYEGEDAVGVVVCVDVQVRVCLGATFAEIMADEVGSLAAVVAETGQEGTLIGLLGRLVTVAVFCNHAHGIQVGYVAMIFGSLAFSLGQLQLVGEERSEIDMAPHLVFPQRGLEVTKLLYYFFHEWVA